MNFLTGTARYRTRNGMIVQLQKRGNFFLSNDFKEVLEGYSGIVEETQKNVLYDLEGNCKWPSEDYDLMEGIVPRERL